MVSKLNPSVSKGYRKEEHAFEFNTDAGLFVCSEGHMAILKTRTGKKYQNKNQVVTHYFDIEKCKSCLSKGDPLSLEYHGLLIDREFS